METEPQRIAISPKASARIRQMGEDLGISDVKVIRRALILFDFYLQLGDGEQLVVLKEDETIERLQFKWETDNADS